MAIDLLGMLKDQVTGQLAGKIGSHLGENPDATSKGLEAILPTVLGGLMKQVSAPGGAAKINETLDQGDYDGSLLDNFGGMVGGGDIGAIGNLGSNLVGMLFGDKVGGLVNIISKLSGMSEKNTTALLGLALPLIMSFLGKQKRTLGLDAGGVQNLLLSQKESVAKALPAGISDALGLGSLGFSSPTSAPAPSKPTPTCSAPQCGGGLMKVLLPLAILGLLGWLGLSMFKDRDVNDKIDVDLPAIDLGIEAGVPELPGMTDLGANLKSSVSQIGDIFAKVNDAESATAQLPELEKINESLETSTKLFEQASAALKSTLGSNIGELLPGLQEKIDQVLAIPGVDAILKPIVDSMMEKFAVFTAAA